MRASAPKEGGGPENPEAALKGAARTKEPGWLGGTDDDGDNDDDNNKETMRTIMVYDGIAIGCADDDGDHGGDNGDNDGGGR